MGMRVEFHRRYQPENQMDWLHQAIYEENLGEGGRLEASLTQLFQKSYGIFNVLWTTSATSALEMAFRLMELTKGDEVIIPSYTFPSVANAVLAAGGIPVFCDIEQETQNIDVNELDQWVSSKTRAVVVSHYGGIPCDMERLKDWALAECVTVVEDSAQGVHTKYKDQWLGTLGDFGAYSFHHTKNFSCGEGGAFLFREKEMVHKASILRENGTNKDQFRRGEVASYSWQGQGSNFVMSATSQALLISQLESAAEITKIRRSIAENYHHQLQEARFPEHGFQLMAIPEEVTPNYHLYYFLCPGYEEREDLRRGLLEDGIDARSHFVPLHLSPMGRKLGYHPEDLPRSRNVAERLLRLPIHTQMTGQQVDYVVDRLWKRVKR